MRRINSKTANRYAISLLIAWIGTLFPALSQEGMPFFQNYTAQEYQAHNRNFDVVCDSSGIAYFANFEGIIYFNGAEWKKILTPGISRITSLCIDHSNKIWAGGHNYIGKISASQNGTPLLKTYISDQKSTKGDLRIGEVTRIEEKGDSLLFFTQNYRIIIRKDSILSVQSIMSDPDSEVPDKRIHIGQSLARTDGTNGLVFTSNENGQPFTMTEANGLCSNAINQIATDRKGSLWAATDNGVFKIAFPSFYSRFTANEGLRGEVTALYRYKRLFYAGTLHGLFLYDKTNARFKQLPLITQSCWQLKESPSGGLYAVTSNGLFRINEDRMEAINDYNTFSLAFDPSDTQTLYTGEIDGVYRIKGQKKEKIADIEKVMKLEFAHGQLWAETLYGEIYHLGTDLSSPILQDSIHGLRNAGGNKLYIRDGDLNVLSRYGFQHWNLAKQRFEKSSHPLDSLLEMDHWWPGLYASTPSGQLEWITGGNGKNLIAFKNGQVDTRTSQILHPIKDYIIRTLYLEENGVAWLGGDFGLVKFNRNEPDASFAHKPEIHIRSIHLDNDSGYFDGNNSNIRQIMTLPIPRFRSSMKNFEFSFSSEANHVIGPVQYSYYLEGYEKSWSPWQTSSKREYTNLSYGTYIFHVKALDAFGRESEESVFSFTILKPFYLKWYCLLAYLGTLILLIFLFFQWRTRKLLREKMHLENIVEQRTQQIREQRDEIAEKSQKLEMTLKELNEAQDQLIRQEKIATVGKLTQGLIDRILNPLNYIINFSHLSTVLLKDMKEDIENEEENVSEDNYDDMQEILSMLNTHLIKIEEHGNSTSRILKAMEEMLSDHNCNFMDTDINKLIYSNLNILKEYYQKEIQASSISISFKPSSEPLIIMADQVQLGKVLMSMMQNCLHALHKKKQKTEFYAEMLIWLERQGDHVFIHLHDNGIGIEQSIMDKIFDPFFTTKTTSEAAGVGLYLSKEIILSHNGWVDVRSAKDEYTEFILSIPIHQSFKLSDNE